MRPTPGTAVAGSVAYAGLETAALANTRTSSISTTSRGTLYQRRPDRIALRFVVLDDQQRLMRPLQESLDLRERVVQRVFGDRLLNLRECAEAQGKDVGVIATAGTVESGAYHDAIVEANPSIGVVQLACPELLDLSRESAATKQLYGVDEKPTDDFGRRCLIAGQVP